MGSSYFGSSTRKRLFIGLSPLLTNECLGGVFVLVWIVCNSEVLAISILTTWCCNAQFFTILPICQRRWISYLYSWTASWNTWRLHGLFLHDFWKTWLYVGTAGPTGQPITKHSPKMLLPIPADGRPAVILTWTELLFSVTRTQTTNNHNSDFVWRLVLCRIFLCFGHL